MRGFLLGFRSARFGFGSVNLPKLSVSVLIKTEPVGKIPITEPIYRSIDRRRMQRSSLEPPRRAASNGGGFILLQSLDSEIFNKTSTIRHLTITLLRHLSFR